MLIFLAIVITLIGLVLVSILPAILRPNAAVKTDGNIERREIFRQQFDEIEQDKIIGVLDAKQYALAKKELERRMLDEVGTANKLATKAKPDKILAAILIVLLPIASIYIYLMIGRPIAIIYPAGLPTTSQEAVTQGGAMPATSAGISGTVRLPPH